MGRPSGQLGILEVSSPEGIKGHVIKVMKFVRCLKSNEFEVSWSFQPIAVGKVMHFEPKTHT